MSVNSKTALAATILSLTFAHSAFAQTTETAPDSTRIKAEDILPETEKNKPSVGEDADDIITNKQLRAQSGSKSRWSFASQTLFSAGSLTNPVSENRPNLQGAAGLTDRTNVQSLVGIGYKLTTSDRIGVDIGLRWLTPFQSGTPSASGGQHYTKFDAADPDILYQKIYQWGPGIQSQFKIGPTFYTSSGYRSLGYQDKFQVIQNNVMPLGHSGVSLGLYGEVDYNTFDKNDAGSKAETADFAAELDPFVEYQISDTFNLRTVANSFVYQHRRNQDAWHADHFAWVQSFGLGISITRDVFLYPNLQFQPTEFALNHTNIGIEADINVF